MYAVERAMQAAGVDGHENTAAKSATAADYGIDWNVIPPEVRSVVLLFAPASTSVMFQRPDSHRAKLVSRDGTVEYVTLESRSLTVYRTREYRRAGREGDISVYCEVENHHMEDGQVVGGERGGGF